MRRQTILRVLVFITALLLTLALPISAHWKAHDAPEAKAPEPRTHAR